MVKLQSYHIWAKYKIQLYAKQLDESDRVQNLLSDSSVSAEGHLHYGSYKCKKPSKNIHKPEKKSNSGDLWIFLNTS
ncbi:unnamed protein product [Bubo scandiacus]